ncbi:hypothetical protein SAMN05421741_1174 [Paenimyroides ummariense]|uniref:MetA-pathway of phenol degradation n=1 Tax=Paenimyroides ummariense TaxID=913024 RepID=A0A1I5DRX6_9FLAO|nr:HAEPLYID family protein [Paenimyroides ummariense]SFO01973.1 hypothetical protein SAMN05421741_1174 [Paenimyroides ummariense]
MNVIKKYFLSAALILVAAKCFSQDMLPEKVSHAEPLYYDLVRDLGARKGEKEFNAGYDFSKHTSYNEHAFLLEYEFAPVDRLGFEVEADFSFFNNKTAAETPGNKIEALRFSSQYSFFVSPGLKTTLAVGYTQIINFKPFRSVEKQPLVTGTVYSPFFVAAKRWGAYVNSLVYAYPLFRHDFAAKMLSVEWQVNTSLLITIPGTKHFAGVEINKEFQQGRFRMTLRPQLKLKLDEHTAVGLVAGIPTRKAGEGFSSFARFIYEP